MRVRKKHYFGKHVITSSQGFDHGDPMSCPVQSVQLRIHEEIPDLKANCFFDDGTLADKDDDDLAGSKLALKGILQANSPTGSWVLQMETRNFLFSKIKWQKRRAKSVNYPSYIQTFKESTFLKFWNIFNILKYFRTFIGCQYSLYQNYENKACALKYSLIIIVLKENCRKF